MSLVVKNLKKTFISGDQKIEVLKDINFEVPKGCIAAIVGQSGSGKSTLLSLLLGLDKADGGEVFYDNTNIIKLSESEMTLFRGQNLSIVFQQYHLVPHLTALENVMIPMEINRKKISIEACQNYLSEVGLEKRINHFPNQLSGGESQRVAIARALASQPVFLFADEPSGNLDVETGKKVMDFYFSLVRKHSITSVIVTHSMELANQCDLILKIEGGLIQIVGK